MRELEEFVQLAGPGWEDEDEDEGRERRAQRGKELSLQ